MVRFTLRNSDSTSDFDIGLVGEEFEGAGVAFGVRFAVVFAHHDEQGVEFVVAAYSNCERKVLAGTANG